MVEGEGHDCKSAIYMRQRDAMWFAVVLAPIVTSQIERWSNHSIDAAHDGLALRHSKPGNLASVLIEKSRVGHSVEDRTTS